MKKINSALVSVFSKEGLDQIGDLLAQNQVTIYSTGGTATFLRDRGIEVVDVESITDYPSILGGRVKTLHPKVFGGILAREDNESDLKELSEYQIPTLDLVVVDLYPFEDTVKSGASEQDIIEKIDIGGISLIRAAAKNHKDTVIVPSKNQYQDIVSILSNGGETTLEQRKKLASDAFEVTRKYDTAISNYFQGNSVEG